MGYRQKLYIPNVKSDVDKECRALIKRYFRLVRINSAWQARFVVGVQSFDIGYLGDLDIAEWYCWQMARAIQSMGSKKK